MSGGGGKCINVKALEQTVCTGEKKPQTVLRIKVTEKTGAKENKKKIDSANQGKNKFASDTS